MKKIIKFILKKIFRGLSLLQSRGSLFCSRIAEKRKIKEKRRVAIQNKVTLTKEQKNQIDVFFKENYGKKIPYNWHKNYYAISGKFDYMYFPELLFIPDVERLLNSPKYYHALQDKNITSLLASGVEYYVKVPEKIISCSNGIYVDFNFNILTKENVYHHLNDRKFFIKPTVDSGSGKNCQICYVDNFIDLISHKSIKDIVEDYGKDFVAQEIITNSKELSKINYTSLNTFRCITYVLDGKVYHMPLILRIGRAGSIVDNAHAGGMFIGVTDEGYLLKTAHTEFGEEYDVHPDSGVVFENYFIPEVKKVIEAAEKLQAQVPHVGCINWDFTIDEEKNVVLIEANMKNGSIWLIQMAHGKSGFEENTAKMLKLVRENKIKY